MCCRCLFNAEECVHNAALCPVPYIIADTGLRHSAIDSCQRSTTHTHTQSHASHPLTHRHRGASVLSPLRLLRALVSKITDLHKLSAAEFADARPNFLCASIASGAAP